MMRGFLLASAVAGCGGGEPAPPLNQARPTVAALGPGECARFGPCYRFANGQCRHIGAEDCAWLPAERMRGLWRTATGEFVPDAGATGDENGEVEAIRLELEPRIVLPLIGAREGAEVRVEFIGRRSRFRDEAGVLAPFRYRVEVQEMVSARVAG
jgi:hypothetical protein